MPPPPKKQELSICSFIYQILLSKFVFTSVCTVLLFKQWATLIMFVLTHKHDLIVLSKLSLLGIRMALLL